ncbi:MAG: phosphatase [Oceanospirillaceae bacterium]|nr:phosphatase [Oceanospirillaceae bacterium]
MDLHCHTTASDGDWAPEKLVAEAAARGIQTLAITDHDTFAGYRQARETASSLGVTLIPGIELSAVWSGITLHIVGLNFDPQSAVIQQAEQSQSEARQRRAGVIAERLSKRIGAEIDLRAVELLAGGDQVGRPHFAQHLINQGHVNSMNQAFSRYLGAGKVGDVKAMWPDMKQAVEWIVDSGGVAVMAHAHLYNMTRTKLKACLKDFIAAGGSAMEVAYGQMDNNQRGQMCALAKEMGLKGSCGSDFHGPNRYGLELGVMPAFPADVPPVWSAWQS